MEAQICILHVLTFQEREINPVVCVSFALICLCLVVRVEQPEVYKAMMHFYKLRPNVSCCSRDNPCSTEGYCQSKRPSQLWDSSTGMVLADFKGHKDMVTCCTMSASGKIIVSSSEDLTVKVRGLFVGQRRGCASFRGRFGGWGRDSFMHG